MNYQLAQNAARCKNQHLGQQRQRKTRRYECSRSGLSVLWFPVYNGTLCYSIRSTRRVSQLSQTAFVAGVRVCAHFVALEGQI